MAALFASILAFLLTITGSDNGVDRTVPVPPPNTILTQACGNGVVEVAPCGGNPLPIVIQTIPTKPKASHD